MDSFSLPYHFSVSFNCLKTASRQISESGSSHPQSCLHNLIHPITGVLGAGQVRRFLVVDV